MNRTGTPTGSGVDWSELVRIAPLLRDLEPATHARLEASARTRRLEADDILYREGDPGEALFVVLDGQVSVRATRRGDDDESQLRVVERGQSVGEEALFPGLSRRASARAVSRALVVELPIAVFRRALARSRDADTADRTGDRVADRADGRADDDQVRDREAERVRRTIARAAARDVIAVHALTRDLPETDRDMIVDAAVFRTVERGARIFSAGEVADESYLIIDGLVQLQADDDGLVKTRVVAYLTGGDLLGDADLGHGARRALTAVAMGPTHLLRVPAAVVRAVQDRNPGLAERAGRMRAAHRQAQAAVMERAAENTTRHVFRDLYRMQVARSLLVIDQDTCVRCGHCAWSCASVHGISRLTRRGDKIVAAVARPDEASARSLAARKSWLIPSSCQHCHNAACMIDCPTGAIGRDPDGEVHIRADLCTGCGHCAKACPWENIRMAPRPPAERTHASLSDLLAVKCDLCRDYQAPACVQACPTGSLLRLHPSQDISEIKDLLGEGSAAGESERAQDRSWRPRPGWTAVKVWSLALALATLPWAMSAHAAGTLSPRSPLGLVAGIAASLMLLGLMAYAAPKRLVRGWMKKRARVSAARLAARAEEAGRTPASAASASRDARVVSRLRPLMALHVALGFACVAAVAMHAGARMPASPAGATQIAFWLTVLVGVWGALVYWLVPSRLARLERRGALPEDLRHERKALMSRLFRVASGAKPRVKRALDQVIIPYASALFGPLALLFSGRDLAREERRLRVLLLARERREQRANHADVPAPRARDTLELGDEIRELVRIAVEIRALPARRAATWFLRAWLPAHILSAAVLMACLMAHLVTISW